MYGLSELAGMDAQQGDASNSTEASFTSPPASSSSTKQQVYRQERVFISHAGPQKGFALHLRTRLRAAGVSTFVDERELLPGADHFAPTVMEAACRQAQLVVFVITRDFLRRAATLQELRWALDQRQQQQLADAATAADGGPAVALPHLLTVMYPTSVSTSWRVPELRQLLQRELQPVPDDAAIATLAERLNAATADTPVDVGELQNGSLNGLLQIYHPAADVAGCSAAAVTAQQAAADLAQLAATTIIRVDSVARGDDLLLRDTLAAVQRTLAPHDQLSMGQLVGLEPQLLQVREALGMGEHPRSPSVLLHGLYGLGGIGKSTLAQRFFEDAKPHFDRAAFLHVGQDAVPGAPLAAKQRQLLSSIGGFADAGSNDAYLRSSLRHSFEHGGPLLLVLDDLWDEQQLVALLGCQAGDSIHSTVAKLTPCSRVLLTSRTSEVIAAAMPADTKPQAVSPLPKAYAQQLLCLRAFGQSTPASGFGDSQLAAAADICGGLPLTLQLLGGALSQHKTTAGWQAVLDEWGTAPGAADDVRLLRKSYEALPGSTHHRMFLDAALLLHGRPQRHLTALWAAQLQQDDLHSGGGLVMRGTGWRSRGKSIHDGSRPQRGMETALRCQKIAEATLQELVQRSFVVLDNGGSSGISDIVGRSVGKSGSSEPGASVRLAVHDRLRDMASEIAQDYGSPARWLLSDLTTDDTPPQGVVYEADRIRCCAAVNTLPTFTVGQLLEQHSALQAAVLPFELLPSGAAAPPAGHTSRLLYLRLSGTPPPWLGSLRHLAVLDLSASQTLQQLPDSLGDLQSLEVLDLSGCCNLTQLPETSSGLVSLRHLALSRCRSLVQLPAGIDRWTGLQQLDMDGCAGLRQLPDSIGTLVGLAQLNIDNCTGLGQLPHSIGSLSTLEQLQVSGCTGLVRLPTGLGDLVNLQRLHMRGYRALPKMPLSMQYMTGLHLDVSRSAELEELPLSSNETLDAWRGLRRLDLSSCPRLQQLHHSISCLTNLTMLDLSGCSALLELPHVSENRLWRRSITCLTALQRLDCAGCQALQHLDLEKVRSLRHLDVSGAGSLTSLDLRGCRSLEALPDGIDSLSSLTYLNIASCLKLSQLPCSISSLSSLLEMDLGGCLALRQLPDVFSALSSLQRLNFGHCVALQHLPGSISSLTNLQRLDVSGCCALLELPRGIRNLGGSLQSLYVADCQALQELDMTDMRSLRHLTVSRAGSLVSLTLRGCCSLEALPDCNSSMSSLQHLDVAGCSSVRYLPTEFGTLSSLLSMDLGACEGLDGVPDLFSGLCSLTLLRLRGCSVLQQLPDSISCVTSLQELDLSGCRALLELPRGIRSLGSSLRRLDITGCQALDKMEVLRMHSLQQLNVGSMSRLQSLTLRQCCSLQLLPDGIGDASSLTSLTIAGCSSVQRLPGSVSSLGKLISMDLSGCSALQALPDVFGGLCALQTLSLKGCRDLQQLPDSIGGASSLTGICLAACKVLKEVPASIGRLSKLRRLDMNGCQALEQLPDSICSLNKLHTLSLCGCQALKQLPPAMGSLSSLSQLDMYNCTTVRQLPDSISELQQLECLNLQCCSSLEAQPANVGVSSSLQQLNLSGCDTLPQTSQG